MITNIFQLLNESIPIHDLLEEAGVKIPTRDRNVKIHCPVHGLDVKASAFIYADTNTMRCFTCNKSWDVVALCAELHEFWKPGPDGEDVLDMGQAIALLTKRYDLKFERPAWETRFRELKKASFAPKGFEDTPQKDREQMAQLYRWSLSRHLALWDKPKRAEAWGQASTLLDEFEDLDLETPTWKSDLNSWRNRAMLLVGGIHADFIT